MTPVARRRTTVSNQTAGLLVVGGVGAAAAAVLLSRKKPVAGPPQPPTNLVVSGVTSSGATVSATGSAGATSYTAKLNGAVVRAGLATPMIALTGLAPSTAESVTFSATGPGGTSGDSAAKTFTTLAGSGAGAPNAPTIKRSALLATSVKVIITKATSGPAATSFTIYNGTAVLVANVPATAAFAALSGLHPSTAYELHATAVNAAGASPSSNVIKFTTPA